ncbi:nucleotide sugar dehydrogenase [Pseudorhodoplanes sp.]|uniref:nucleotide sugar dehydrogenase n=1 Tax=Pseudorhodoplanes sp. TaxID=1934341 RepID=UPI003D152426
MGTSQRNIAVVGLGYVGLPVALAFARKFHGVVGFDIDDKRVATLRQGIDWSGETDAEDLKRTTLRLTCSSEDLVSSDLYIVCVPTPVHSDRRPDFGPLIGASKLIGQKLKKDDIVVYESTVYPGATEEICGPVLANESGLSRSDFKLGYSPERINPGDREHSFERIVKVVAGEDAESTKVIAEIYGSVVEAGVHIASSIKVAEAAKVLENTQRDLNIALMNELALICERIGIRTKDVLEAAGTKWNFLRFTPGLVGGHCIGVDPYYLTAKAEQLGYHPQVILAGRRINDAMGGLIARRLVSFLGATPQPLSKARVGILGLTFKENVPDIRNSKVPDIVTELSSYGVKPLVADPLVDEKQVLHEYGLKLSSLDDLRDLDVLVLAVPHRAFLADTLDMLSRLKAGGTVMDVKSALEPSAIPSKLNYWSL